jgi:hypothetical protein
MKKFIATLMLTMVLGFALGTVTPALADGGPLPLCPPCKPGGSKDCGPNCKCPVYNCIKAALRIN